MIKICEMSFKLSSDFDHRNTQPTQVGYFQFYLKANLWISIKLKMSRLAFTFERRSALLKPRIKMFQYSHVDIHIRIVTMCHSHACTYKKISGIYFTYTLILNSGLNYIYLRSDVSRYNYIRSFKIG